MNEPADSARSSAMEWAAASSVARIRRAMRQASSEVGEHLAILRKNLFVEGFKAGNLREGKSHAAEARFSWEVGESPGQLITGCRLETARRLLISTDLKVARIIDLVGMTGRTFYRAFKRRYEQSPGAYRKLFPALGEKRAGARENPSRALAEEAREQPDLLFRIRDTPYEEATAEWLVRSMVAMEHDVALVELGRVGVDSPRVFELLCEHGQQAGRQSRQRGVELAELALAWVETNSAFLKELTPRLRALGLARLGNARILAADPAMAEQDFRRAAEALEDVPWPDRAATLSEVYWYQGALRGNQRRLEEAQEILKQAIAQARAARVETLEVKIWAQLATVYLYQGDIDQARPALREAQRLVEESPLAQDPLLRLGISLQNAGAQALAGDIEEAEKLLPTIKKLAKDLENLPARLQGQWIEAMIHTQRGDLDAAQKLLEEARQGFNDIGDPDHAAIAAIDLALLHERQGHSADVLLLASDALSVLESLHLPEAEKARGLLERAIANQAITRRQLKNVRKLLTFQSLAA